MLWRVTGTNQAGVETSIDVEGADHLQAKRRAERQGLRVSEVQQFNGAVPPGAAPSPAAAVATPAVPNYSAILDGARSIAVLANVLRIVGLAVLALSAIGLLLAVTLAMGPGGMAAIAAGVVPAISGLISGLLLLAVASMLLMVGSIGLAVRDVARNSFGRP